MGLYWNLAKFDLCHHPTMFRMSAFNKTWIFAAGEDAALDECPLKFFLLIPALLRGTFIHCQISAGVTGFFSYSTWIFTGERDLLWKCAKDLLIFVSHGMKNHTPSQVTCSKWMSRDARPLLAVLRTNKMTDRFAKSKLDWMYWIMVSTLLTVL